MVTSPADGIPAAPIAAAVAVKLAGKSSKKTVDIRPVTSIINSEKICISQYFLESIDISHVPLEREARSRGRREVIPRSHQQNMSNETKFNETMFN